MWDRWWPECRIFSGHWVTVGGWPRELPSMRWTSVARSDGGAGCVRCRTGAGGRRGVQFTGQRALAARGIRRWVRRTQLGCRSGVDAYVVSLRESIPNGRRLSTRQWVVKEPRLRVAPTTAPGMTKVFVEVTARCPGATSRSSAFGFVVDGARSCPTPTALAFAAATDDRVYVNWDKPAGAAHFEVRAFRLSDGAPLAAWEASNPPATLPAPFPGVAVSVVARCRGVSSSPALGVYATGRRRATPVRVAARRCASSTRSTTFRPIAAFFWRRG